MSLEKTLEEMLANRNEIYDSIVARKGEYGHAYGAIVKEAARAIAVIQAISMVTAKDQPHIAPQLIHSVSCILSADAYSAMYACNIAPTLDGIASTFTQEFMTDVTVLTKYMVLPLKGADQE